MTIDRRTLIGTGLALTATGIASSAIGQTSSDPLTWPARQTLNLWPKAPPGTPRTRPAERKGVDMPTLSVYRAARPDGRAVLSIPGGGYAGVSVENEGSNIARALTPHGISVFVLNYRLPIDGWEPRANAPVQDAQRAIRMIRSNASRFGIDPNKVGIAGFSAGGHLGGVLATAYNDRVYAPVDRADELPARPDFAGLIYPVSTLAARATHSVSAENLLGPKPDRADVARLSPDVRVNPDTPPLFLVHAMDDSVVPVDMSLMLIAAARAAGIPVEAHLYEKGGHGFGVGNGDGHPARGWTDRFAAWSATHV